MHRTRNPELTGSPIGVVKGAPHVHVGDSPEARDKVDVILCTPCTRGGFEEQVTSCTPCTRRGDSPAATGGEMKNLWKASGLAKALGMSEEQAGIAMDELVEKGFMASAQGAGAYTLSQESIENRDLLLTIVKEELERRGLSPLEE